MHIDYLEFFLIDLEEDGSGFVDHAIQSLLVKKILFETLVEKSVANSWCAESMIDETGLGASSKKIRELNNAF